MDVDALDGFIMKAIFVLCRVHFAEMKEIIGSFSYHFIIFIPFHNFHTIFLIIGSACLNLHRNIFSLNHDSHLKNTFDLDSACSLVM